MIDVRSLVRGVVLQALYELDSTYHATSDVVKFRDDLTIAWDDIHAIAYLALRKRLQGASQRPTILTFELPLKLSPDKRTPVQQVLIDALTEGLEDEDISEEHIALVECVVDVDDLEDFDLKVPNLAEVLPLTYQQQARRWIEDIQAHRAALNLILADYAPDYPLEQISPIDRNILMIAIYEFGISRETKLEVAIDEAVEMAKIFGSESSYRFVNGVLGAFARDQAKIVARLQQEGET